MCIRDSDMNAVAQTIDVVLAERPDLAEQYLSLIHIFARSGMAEGVRIGAPMLTVTLCTVDPETSR